MTQYIDLIKEHIDGKTTTSNTVKRRENDLLLPIGGQQGKKFRLLIENPRQTESQHADIELIIKEINSEYDANELPELCQVYRKLYVMGYPVPPTVRYIDGSPRCLVMTDLRYSGKYLLWGFNDSPNLEELNQLRLMNLTKENVSKIREKITKLANKSIVDNVQLQGHYYHVRRNVETADIDIVLLDVSPLVFFEPIPETTMKEVEFFMKCLLDELQKV